ncbi:MAG TPA: hypothetical protein VIF62_37020 [Labilithrix sp.]|jgi:hypothetical protein
MRGRHLFAIGSFTGAASALAVAAGCGERMTTISEYIDGGPPMPTTTTPPAPVRPKPTETTTSLPPPPPPPFEGGPPACPTLTPIDPSTLPWEPPAAAKPGACTEADLAALDTILPDSTNDDSAKPVISASCAACVFASGLSWGPIPETTSPDGGHVPLTVDVGGCYAIATGSAACGKTTQNLYDCERAACADCPTGDAIAYVGCVKAATAFGGACASELSVSKTTCAALDASTYDAAQGACEPPPPVKYTFDGPVRVMCMTDPDAGDAGDGG